MFDPENEQNEKEDYFNSSQPPKKEEKKPKSPVLTPEDPRYWEREESEWEHLRPRRDTRFWIWIGAGAVFLALIVACYLRYFSPYRTEAVQYGYVERIAKEGTIFTTFEGVLLPYKELMDTTRVYRHDFVFTAADAHVAAELKRMEKLHRPVRVEYVQYHAAVPWRGMSKIIVTAVDSVDASRILPPEYRPAID